MPNSFAEYFRCPEAFADFGVSGELSAEAGYFTFRNAICYGRPFGAAAAECATSVLPDVSLGVEVTNGRSCLPFDLSEVVTNLREERYHRNSLTALDKVIEGDVSRSIYYFFRPFLPIAARKHLQRIYLRGWEKIAFPRWPVDVTVETLMQSAMRLSLGSSGQQFIPFIWFWPDGAPSAAIVTHDVEGPAGLEFCSELMDIDDAFGVKAAFQIVPELRYETSRSFFEVMRSRGCEVNVHDLNHDGHLFDDRSQFRQRAAQINRYVQEFGSRGFRSGGMYREPAWFESLDVSFDMSVPNVAHLEPQRGGCCTVMPYFIGNIVELPLTTIQDYSLFHMLGEYSIEPWKKQIELILSRNGLVSILTHPDYLIEKRARTVYRDLLEYLRGLRESRPLWFALPGDVDRWWRSRSAMVLVPDGDAWRIEGPDADRARVAYATLENGQVVYMLSQEPAAPDLIRTA